MASAGSATDPFFSSVVLLMGFEGANGSQGAPGYTDEKSSRSRDCCCQCWCLYLNQSIQVWHIVGPLARQRLWL